MTRAIAFHATLASLLFVWGVAAQAQTPASGTPASKAPDLAKGAAIASQVCAACHAADGNATGNAYPKLAGQHAEYLVKQLSDFKSGERANPIMAPYAAALSTQDMENVAAYFSGQKQNPSAAKNKDTMALGRKIFRGGIAEKHVPACASCHGPTGAGIPVQYPRISGQWEEYTEAQLVAFRSGARKNSVPMAAIASRLSDAEIKAVADYIAGLR